MISKELLSEVLEFNVESITTINSKNINQLLILGEKTLEINTYELAHKCKEWVLSQGFQFRTFYPCNGTESWGIGKCKNGFDLYQAGNIEDACQWLLDNKDRL